MDHPTTPVPCSIMNDVRSVWYVIIGLFECCPSLRDGYSDAHNRHLHGIRYPFPACLGGLKRPPIPYRYWHARSTTYKLYVVYHAAFLSSSCWLCQEEDFICPFVETKTSRIRGLPHFSPEPSWGPHEILHTHFVF
jgi:hypothetical protein